MIPPTCLYYSNCVLDLHDMNNVKKINTNIFKLYFNLLEFYLILTNKDIKIHKNIYIILIIL
jgi:hypothetical protein